MNLFFLHYNPVVAASQQCDKHVVKMLLETAQILSSVCRLNGIEHVSLYKQTHVNHPVVVWTRASRKNFEWVLAHGLALCAEYTRRYGKVHKSERVIKEIVHLYTAINFSAEHVTLPPLCMPDEFKRGHGLCIEDIVSSYRNYYMGPKRAFAKWKFTECPEWFIQ